MTSPPWNLVVASPVCRAIGRIPPKVAVAVVEFLVGPLTANPGVGRALRDDLRGLHAARVGAYRVAYVIDQALRTVRVLYVEHPADVYRPR